MNETLCQRNLAIIHGIIDIPIPFIELITETNIKINIGTDCVPVQYTSTQLIIKF